MDTTPPTWATTTAAEVGAALGFAPTIREYSCRSVSGVVEHRVALADDEGPRAIVKLYGVPVDRVVVQDFERDDHDAPGALDGVGPTLADALASMAKVIADRADAADDRAVREACADAARRLAARTDSPEDIADARDQLYDTCARNLARGATVESVLDMMRGDL